MSGATMSEASEVLVSRDGAVVTLTINRPRAKNSLNRAVFDGLRAQLAQLRDDDAVRAVVITGAEGVFAQGPTSRPSKSARRTAAGRPCGGRLATSGRNWSASQARHRSGGKARAGRRHGTGVGLRHR
jgi:enoyl-CoA hydratase